jgi:hypothetical protein
MFRSAHFSLLVVGSLLALSACNESPTEPSERYVWEATGIVPNEPGDLTFVADAYVDASNGVISTGIRIVGPVPGTAFGWLFRLGECGSGGDAFIAGLPNVTIESDGDGEVALNFFGALEGTEEFSVEIYHDPQGAAVLVGCGAMLVVDL